MFITDVLWFLKFDNPTAMKILYFFLYCVFSILVKDLESLFDAVLRQYGLTGDDVGWWCCFDESRNSINNVDIGFCNTVDFVGAKS